MDLQVHVPLIRVFSPLLLGVRLHCSKLASQNSYVTAHAGLNL